jgi:hypothetical protein
MQDKIETYSTLYNLVDIDKKNHKLKELAELFLNAMTDWPNYNQTEIVEFITELKDYFGTPLTIEKIANKQFNGGNAWQIESGSSISGLIDISTKFCNESNFDNIVNDIINYYEQEFSKVDFIAELHYLTTEQGGRQTPASSGYRPQVKFDFADMQTSGQQTFIGKEIVYPGETVDAKIKIISFDYFAHTLTKNLKFEFREGPRIIGYGIIKHIINDKLEKASS